jgi:hypothetical protein
MAVGPAPMGLAYFAAVKLCGYSVAGVYLNRRYASRRPASPWVVGVVRTGIGLVVGIGAIALASSLSIARSEVLFYVLLAPIRVGEWLLLLAIFFERPWSSWSRALKFAGLGSLWSYVLDAPAIAAAFSLPGGVWIC